MSCTSVQELLVKYSGRGERSIEESARMVGLGLPDHGTPSLTAEQKEGVA